ncbi:MAG TPA: TIR domain-containing protein [Pyrinomonadaceae bacterium]|nr:TIR domain-containing protein [Pyrinomonadaceae bacterium]
MNVLLSWSKEKSRVAASALHEWLPTILPGIEPWMSSKDIAKGREWFNELQGVLEQTRICIICLTMENVRSPWIYYETGAIANNGPNVLICPYLIGLGPSILADGPLGKWQCTTADREDTWKLIRSLNQHALDSKHDLAMVEGHFQTSWMTFRRQIEKLLIDDTDDNEEFVSTDVDQMAGLNLTSEAREMVLKVAKDPDGRLLYVTTYGGTIFQAGGSNVCPDQSPRTVAKWKRALDALVANKILESQGHKGNVFALTALGFDIADVISGDASLRRP